MRRISMVALLLAVLAPIQTYAENAVPVCSVDYQPYTKSDLGEGVWADLVNAAFKSAGVAVNWQVLPSARCNEMARDGRMLAAFNSVKTFEKDKEIVFEPTPMFNIDMVAFYDSR